jgi:hypothetical protein
VLDYIKFWVHDKESINYVEQHCLTDKNYKCNDAGELVEISGSNSGWKFKSLSRDCLEVAGSLHKYWNNGANHNDFHFSDVVKTINKFCTEFNINASTASVKNLEFGVNLQLPINADDIIKQVVCFDKQAPSKPYEHKPDCTFIEFTKYDYYLKLYDKGKQYKNIYPEAANTLRIEIKGMNNRYLGRSSIKFLTDLLDIKNLSKLSHKLSDVLDRLVFDDDSIDVFSLNEKELILYNEYRNPRFWGKYKGDNNTQFKKRAYQFKYLVNSRGDRHIYSLMNAELRSKLLKLSR